MDPNAFRKLPGFEQFLTVLNNAPAFEAIIDNTYDVYTIETFLKIIASHGKEYPQINTLKPALHERFRKIVEAATILSNTHNVRGRGCHYCSSAEDDYRHYSSHLKSFETVQEQCVVCWHHSAHNKLGRIRYLLDDLCKK